MARKLRLQFPGAIYHVINRGNYRADVFETDGAKTVFLDCLDKACGKTGWRIYAWSVMTNHYHLALETPEPNLSEGMRWLQATFAARFNRFRKASGHLFQGRFKAHLVEDGEPLAAVCHYIHLNPVRAGLVGAAGLTGYPWTSIGGWLMRPRARPGCYDPGPALAGAGELADTAPGRRRYLEYLAWMSQDVEGQRRAGFDRMCKGWAFGSRDFKKAVLKDHGLLEAALASEELEDGDAREMAWELMVSECLQVLDKNEEDLKIEAKSAAWKIAIAAFLKERCLVKNRWLAERLSMGSAKSVSCYVHAAATRPSLELKSLVGKLTP
jgi:putative transposase